MTVGNVQVDRSKEAGSSATESGGNSYYYILNHGTMIIDGAQVRSNGCYSSLISNGWQSPGQNSDKGNSVMTVKSGSFSVTFASGGLYVLKNDDYGVMTVEGGTFTAGNTEGGVVLNWNDLTIKGGTFNGGEKAAIVNAVEANEDGSLKHPDYEKGTIQIKGGTFNGSIGNHGSYPGRQNFCRRRKL